MIEKEIEENMIKLKNTLEQFGREMNEKVDRINQNLDTIERELKLKEEQE